ncbi:hypothetical protein ACWD7C_34045 [Streptomyces sp. NPDC005134]
MGEVLRVVNGIKLYVEPRAIKMTEERRAEAIARVRELWARGTSTAVRPS